MVARGTVYEKAKAKEQKHIHTHIHECSFFGSPWGAKNSQHSACSFVVFLAFSFSSSSFFGVWKRRRKREFRARETHGAYLYRKEGRLNESRNCHTEWDTIVHSSHGVNHADEHEETAKKTANYESLRRFWRWWKSIANCCAKIV